MASDSYGGYFQVLTGGIAVGVNGRGHFTMSIYHQVGVGPASVAAVNWDSDSGFSYSAGAGIGTITGMPGPTAIAWYDMHQHSANVAFGGGVTDLLEIGYWESWPMDWPNFRSFFIDPLVLDLNGDGVKLVGVSDSTAYFDFDGDGFREKTGWFSPQDGLLVRDLNGNGRIESLLEMIGTANQDAYAVLRGFDQNGDLEITASDQVWASLLIWQDSNSNGITDAGELKTLSSLGITSIGLSNLNLDINRTGNYVHSQSEFNANGRGGVTEAVYFETAKNIGIFVPPVDFEPDGNPPVFGGGSA